MTKDQVKELAEYWGKKAVQSALSGWIVSAQYHAMIATRFAVRFLSL